MIIRGKEKWKEVIEAQKQSGLTIKKYCNDNHICISSFYKQKALILEEENTFLPVIIDKSNDVIDFDIENDGELTKEESERIWVTIKNCYDEDGERMEDFKIFMSLKELNDEAD